MQISTSTQIILKLSRLCTTVQISNLNLVTTGISPSEPACGSLQWVLHHTNHTMFKCNWKPAVLWGDKPLVCKDYTLSGFMFPLPHTLCPNQKLITMQEATNHFLIFFLALKWGWRYLVHPGGLLHVLRVTSTSTVGASRVGFGTTFNNSEYGWLQAASLLGVRTSVHFGEGYGVVSTLQRENLESIRKYLFSTFNYFITMLYCI